MIDIAKIKSAVVTLRQARECVERTPYNAAHAKADPLKDRYLQLVDDALIDLGTCGIEGLDELTASKQKARRKDPLKGGV